MAPQKFPQWMQAVDDAVWSIAGVSVYDLPDCPFRDWFEDQEQPRTAALHALERAGWR
jgi:hypothetical protein